MMKDHKYDKFDKTNQPYKYKFEMAPGKRRRVLNIGEKRGERKSSADAVGTSRGDSMHREATRDSANLAEFIFCFCFLFAIFLLPFFGLRAREGAERDEGISVVGFSTINL
jgi:hypothetical protein